MNINWVPAHDDDNPSFFGRAFHNMRSFAVKLHSNNEGEFGTLYIVERTNSGENKSYRIHEAYINGTLGECKNQFEEWVKKQHA